MASRNTSFLTVDGVCYLVHHQALVCFYDLEYDTKANPSQGTIAEQVSSSAVIPVVVSSSHPGLSSVAQILKNIKRFALVDDVFSQSFAKTLVIQSCSVSNNAHLFAQAKSSGHFSAIYTLHPKSNAEILPSGPYFLCSDSIHQAWRLYEDYLDSFIFSVIPDNVLDPKR
jgi:hypothetical protein